MARALSHVSPSGDLVQPNDKRLALDTRLLDIAQRLEKQGSADDARQLRRSLAYLRDAWYGADAFTDPNFALVVLRDSAQTLIEVMHRSDRINAE